MRDARLAGIAAASRLARKGRGYRRYFARAHRGNRSRIEGQGPSLDNGLEVHKTPVCACVSLSRDAAQTSGGYGWPASTTL